MDRAKRRAHVWAMAALLAGCQAPNRPAADYAAARTPIPALARHPYRLYAIEEGSGRVIRMSLDGTTSQLLVDVEPSAPDSPSPLRLSASGVNVFYGSNRPGATVRLEGAFDGRGSIELQSEHELQRLSSVLPIWEDLAIDYRPPGQANQSTPFDPRFASRHFNFVSPWTIRYFSKVATVDDREMSHVAKVRLDHRDGRQRSHTFRAHPAAATEVLAIFESRYVVLFDNPDVVLWDLGRDVKTLLCRAFAAKIARFEPELNTKPPRASVRKGADLFEWNLRSPSDLAIQDQHLVQRPVQ